MNINTGIYKITNPIGQVYIGQSIDIDRRLSQHQNSSSNAPKLKKSILKFGFDNHNIEIIHLCGEQGLNEAERYYQDLYCVMGSNGLNRTLTGSKHAKAIYDVERNQRIKEKLTGVKRPKEVGEKISIAQKGKKVPNYVREKISKTLKGKPSKGKTFQKGQIPWNKGLSHSEATKERLREARAKQKPLTKEQYKLIGDKTRGVNNGNSKLYLLNEQGIFLSHSEVVFISQGKSNRIKKLFYNKITEA